MNQEVEKSGELLDKCFNEVNLIREKLKTVLTSSTIEDMPASSDRSILVTRLEVLYSELSFIASSIDL